MVIVLIGYMGSGKSVVGRQLALSLGFEFKDLDTVIEIEEGKTITQLFSEKGEIYFRKKERMVLESIIGSKKNIVLATGGGTPCFGDTIQLLVYKENVITIYLKTSIATLTNRLFPEITKRPLLSHIETKEVLHDFISKHLFERSYYYNQALLKLDTNDKSIDDIVKAIELNS